MHKEKTSGLAREGDEGNPSLLIQPVNLMPDIRVFSLQRTLLAAALLIGAVATAHADPVSIPASSIPDYGIIRRVSETLPVPPRSPWSALPESIQDADTGISLIGGLLQQHYVEDDTGATLDAEHGSIPFLRLSGRGQYNHFGWGAGLRYATGPDNYDGGLQSCTQGGCTVTPATRSTGNKILDLTLDADYGFSPLPHLALLPGLFVSQHLWLRDLHGVDGYDERYSHRMAGAQLGLRYNLDRFVLGLRGRYGVMFSPHNTASITPATFDLGPGAYSALRLRLTWAATSRIHLFIGDEYSGFSYGASQGMPCRRWLGAAGTPQPHPAERHRSRRDGMVSHKSAGPETATQTAVREFWAAWLASRGVTVGWGRDQYGHFFTEFARDAEAAWIAAASTAPAGFSEDEIETVAAAMWDSGEVESLTRWHELDERDAVLKREFRDQAVAGLKALSRMRTHTEVSVG